MARNQAGSPSSQECHREACLFVIYINDIGKGIKDCFYNLFADDTKIGKAVGSDAEHRKLQAGLDGAVEWSRILGMPFNVDKCKVMHLGHSNTKRDYKMAGQSLGKTESEKDVGVTVTPSMKWSKQCAKVAKTASMVLGQISRAFSYRYRDKVTFIRLYKSYVRPHLEFSSQAWRPWLQKDIQQLEKVQIRTVNMVGGLKGHTYRYMEKLAEIGLQSLEARRREADLMLMYKVMNGNCKVNATKWKKASHMGHPHTRAAADETRLEQPRARLDIRRNFYTVRIPEQWNGLPPSLRAESTVPRFKTALHAHERAHAAGNGHPRGLQDG